GAGAGLDPVPVRDIRLGSTVSVLTLSVVMLGAVKLRSAGGDIASVQFSTFPLAAQAALAGSVEPTSNADAMSNATAASVANPEMSKNLCLNHSETTRDSTALDRTRAIITPQTRAASARITPCQCNLSDCSSNGGSQELR
ncbi:hypothetical protein, partial [Mesorhizobium norvegicum]|uniref:hypothetical protein n=1 Tax=Mesorhizobium norvegicum TaxID=1085774 RepID=UPI001459FDBB